MVDESHENCNPTLEHLVDVVRGLRRGEPGAEAISVSPEPVANPVKCVNCGYIQEGQPVDRCPECGLLWASRLHDPTPWSLRPSVSHLFLTALDVWRWDRRTRVRTSLVPVAPESAQFANLCALLSAVLLGFAFAVALGEGSGSGTPWIALFAAEVLLGGILGYGLLRCLTWVTRISLGGMWRRELRFVPASIHYATAWWPPAALLLLVLAVLLLAPDLRREDRVLVMWLVGLWGAAAWAFWLWGSVGESGHVSLPGVRIAFVLIGVIAVAFQLTTGLLAIRQASPVKTMARLVTMTGGLTALGRTATSTLTNAPRTYALLIDCIPSDDERMIAGVLSRLGAVPETTVLLNGRGATLAAIEKAFYDLGGRIRKGDRFVVYLNGHGLRDGSGAIVVADGPLTAQKLRYLLSGAQTNRCFVVIDSCFGGKFISGLRGSCNAVVLASTDDRNVAFRSGLVPFWCAMASPESDWNGDGRLTIKEAYLQSYSEMLKKGEQTRRRAASVMPPGQYMRGLAGVDSSSPQLEALGEVDQDDFYVQTPPVPTAASQPGP